MPTAVYSSKLGAVLGLFRITYRRTATIVVCLTVWRRLFASGSRQLIDIVTLLTLEEV